MSAVEEALSSGRRRGASESPAEFNPGAAACAVPKADEVSLASCAAQYLTDVSHTGRCEVSWPSLKPYLRQKVVEVLVARALCAQLLRSVAKEHSDLPPEWGSLESLELEIVGFLEDLSGVPFTIQRLCELLYQEDAAPKSARRLVFALRRLLHLTHVDDSENDVIPFGALTLSYIPVPVPTIPSATDPIPIPEPSPPPDAKSSAAKGRPGKKVVAASPSKSKLKGSDKKSGESEKDKSKDPKHRRRPSKQLRVVDSDDELPAPAGAARRHSHSTSPSPSSSATAAAAAAAAAAEIKRKSASQRRRSSSNDLTAD